MSFENLNVEPVDLNLLDENSEILQTGFWGRFKEKFGWNACGFKISYVDSSENEAEIKVLVLSRKVVGNIWFCYVPFGPPYKPDKSESSDFLYGAGMAIASQLRKVLGGGGSLCVKPLFVRFDLPWRTDGDDRRNKIGGKVRKAPVDIQPPSTVILSLRETEEDLLRGMKSKTRYNIRLAFKRGVSVIESGIEDLSLWYDMYRETAERDRIAIHSLEYYTYLFELARDYRKSYGREGPLLKLLLARVGKEVVAGNIVSFWGDTARYLYGASTGRKRNLMPTYALQWEAITMAKRLGYRYYDFFGIPPGPDPSHPMYGLYRFKTGFGGKIVHRYGCYDVPVDLLFYSFYTKAERARQFYFKKLRKRLG